MLDKFIKESADLASYSEIELNSISYSVNSLKDILADQPNFMGPFIGGSFKRGTLVKKVSDVDVHFIYTGSEGPMPTLARLKTDIATRYPKTYTRQGQPSVMFSLGAIPFKINIYRRDEYGNMSISDDFFLNWRPVNFRKLEKSVISLSRKSKMFIDLIKVLKLWNFNYAKGLMNGDIEDRVCKLFLNSKETLAEDDLPEMMWAFFNHNKFQPVANRLFSLMKKRESETALKSEWMKFIGNE